MYLYEIKACLILPSTAQALRDRMRAAVEAEYPEQEGHLDVERREGTIPASILELLEAAQESQTAAVEASQMCEDVSAMSATGDAQLATGLNEVSDERAVLGPVRAAPRSS